METIKKQLEQLEVLADVYSEIDWTRYEQIVADIRKLELKLLDMMVNTLYIEG